MKTLEWPWLILWQGQIWPFRRMNRETFRISIWSNKIASNKLHFNLPFGNGTFLPACRYTPIKCPDVIPPWFRQNHIAGHHGVTKFVQKPKMDVYNNMTMWRATSMGWAPSSNTKRRQRNTSTLSYKIRHTCQLLLASVRNKTTG